MENNRYATLEVSKIEVLDDILCVNEELKDKIKNELEEYINDAKNQSTLSFLNLNDDGAENTRILCRDMIEKLKS